MAAIWVAPAVLGVVALVLLGLSLKLVVEAVRVGASLDERFDIYLAERFPGEPLESVESAAHQRYEKLVAPAAYVSMIVGAAAFVVITLAFTSDFVRQPIGATLSSLVAVAVAATVYGSAFANREHEVELRVMLRRGTAAVPYAPQFHAVAPLDAPVTRNEPTTSLAYGSRFAAPALPIALAVFVYLIARDWLGYGNHSWTVIVWPLISLAAMLGAYRFWTWGAVEYFDVSASAIGRETAWRGWRDAVPPHRTRVADIISVKVLLARGWSGSSLWVMTRTRHGEDLRNPGFPPFRAHPLADAAAVLRRLLEVTKPEVVGDDVRCLSRILDALSAAEQQAFATTAQQVAELLDPCKLEQAALLAENTPQESGLQAVAADVRALPELVARPVVVPQLPVGDRERHPRRIG